MYLSKDQLNTKMRERIESIQSRSDFDRFMRNLETVVDLGVFSDLEGGLFWLDAVNFYHTRLPDFQ